MPIKVTVNAHSGKLISLEIFPCCTHGFIHPYPFLSKGNIKVSVDGLKTGKHFNLKFVDGCRQDSCNQNWTLPKLNKGTYNLVVRISNDEDEGVLLDEAKNLLASKLGCSLPFTRLQYV